MMFGNSSESHEWLGSPPESGGSGVAQEYHFHAHSGEESVQDLIQEIGELQIKKGFLLSKLEKQQGQLDIVKRTESIEPTLQHLCAQRFELYKDCLHLGKEVKRLRALYEEIEDSLGNSHREELLYYTRNQIREKMASFESHEALRKKIIRSSSAINSEAVKCLKVLKGAKVHDELQEMLFLTMEELSALREYITNSGFSLEELEAMSDVDLQRVVLRDLGLQLESLKDKAQISTPIRQSSLNVEMSTPNCGFDDEQHSVAFNDDVECHIIPSRTDHPKKRKSLEKSCARRMNRKKSSKRSNVSLENADSGDSPDFLNDDLPTGDFF